MADNWYARTQAKYIAEGNPERLANFQRSYAEYQRLGRGGYIAAHPEVFGQFGPTGTTYGARHYASMKMAALGNLMGQFWGPEAAWIRWLIGERISQIGRKFDMEMPEREPPPVPDWMQEYVIPQEEVIPSGRRGIRRPPQTRTTYQLRPLSAQAKLSPEQQSLMAGFQAWQKAGAPTRYSESAIERMSDIDRWWSPYQMESQAMFPKSPIKPRWATAVQR